jgi:plastocyanin
VILAEILVAGQARAETIRIEVKGLAFLPAQVTAHVGDTIEWSNSDFVAHTATARNNEWDVPLPSHGKGQTVLDKFGTVEYFCRFHPNMKGQITIQAK